MSYRLAAVEWSDVRCDQADMFSHDEIASRSGIIFVTFGLLVRDDPEFVAVASEICENGHFRGVTTIHRALVKRIMPVITWPKRHRNKRETPRVGTGTQGTSPVLRTPEAHGGNP